MNNPRWIIPFCSNIVLFILIHTLNSLLIGKGLYISAEPLFLIFPLLFLKPRIAIPLILITGFALDAITPIPFGSRCLLFLSNAIIINGLKSRIRRESSLHVNTILQLSNIVFLGFFTVISWQESMASGAWFTSLFTTLCLSSVFLHAIGVRYVSTQIRLFLLAGINLGAESRT